MPRPTIDRIDTFLRERPQSEYTAGSVTHALNHGILPPVDRETVSRALRQLVARGRLQRRTAPGKQTVFWAEITMASAAVSSTDATTE